MRIDRSKQDSPAVAYSVRVLICLSPFPIILMAQHVSVLSALGLLFAEAALLYGFFDYDMRKFSLLFRFQKRFFLPKKGKMAYLQYYETTYGKKLYNRRIHTLHGFFPRILFNFLVMFIGYMSVFVALRFADQGLFHRLLMDGNPLFQAMVDYFSFFSPFMENSELPRVRESLDFYLTTSPTYISPETFLVMVNAFAMMFVFDILSYAIYLKRTTEGSRKYIAYIVLLSKKPIFRIFSWISFIFSIILVLVFGVFFALEYPFIGLATFPDTDNRELPPLIFPPFVGTAFWVLLIALWYFVLAFLYDCAHTIIVNAVITLAGIFNKAGFIPTSAKR